ncbi:hypothetical protein HK104_010431 [Borealophlyctis nickersoniae]|nr:hypothetical protein HK104_010431 [Borealophlyctis nickersoniae]
MRSFIVSGVLSGVGEVERGLPLNLYNYMGVSQSSDMKELKSNYRTLSLQYHPDKVQGLTGEARARQEALYLKIRFAYDVLKDPHKRAVYDRFGEDVFTCARCQTERDYLLASLNGFLTFYSGSALLLGVLSILGKLDFGRYWRFVGLIAMAALEAGMLVGQADPLSYVFPWRTTQERVIMLRESFIVAFIAVSQIGPVLFPEKKSVRQSLLELETLTDMQLKESTVNFKSAFEPFADDPVAAGELQRKIEKMAVDLQLLENANLSAAASRAQSRKKRKSRAT